MRLPFLHNLLPGNIIQAFCWMLVHSLWQGLAFTIITGLVMLATKKSSARVRYNAVAVLFFLFVAVCAVTFIKQLTGSAGPAQQDAQNGTVSITGMQAAVKIFSGYFSANAPLIVMGWFVVFCFKCIRMAGSLAYSQRVKHHKTHLPAGFWNDKVEALSKSLHIKRTVRLLESEIVKIPVVIGHFKPIIFIPLGLLSNLPAGEVEAVLLHELAHIRRNDYFVNFIQVIAENIFFFNPALLWMSSLLREERENCCDDMALAQTKSKKQFIQALISFKEHALHTSSYTTAFPAKKNQLLQRVSRIVHNKNKSLNTAEKAFFLASFLLLAVFSVAVSNGQEGIPVREIVKNVSVANSSIADEKPAVAAEPIVTVVKKVHFIKDERVHKTYAVKPQRSATTEAGESKSESIAVSQKTAREDKEAAAKQEKVEKPSTETLTDAQQAELDRQQAVKDQAQAELDKRQADEDRRQADLDRKQADEDRKQAMRDQEQAEADRKQAEVDRQEAIKSQQEALKNQSESLKNKAAAARQPKKH